MEHRATARQREKTMKSLRHLIFGLLFSLQCHAVIPENGWWWNPSESGRGFNLEVQDNLLFFASFAYDANGNPAWYTAGGPMTSDRDWSQPLVVTSRGQCFGCSYVEPVRTVAGTVTLRFTSSQTAILTINGFSISVQRFDFWWNGLRPDAMAGEWSAVIGAAADLFDGERIQYTQKVTDASGTYLTGARLGSSGSPAVVQYNASLGQWVAVLDSSTSFYRAFRFSNTGFNRVEGNFWLYQKGSSPTGSGTFYQGFKTASYAFLTTGQGPASTKSAPAEADFEKRDADLFSKLLQRADAKQPVPDELANALKSLELQLETLKKRVP
jgi:hypothetical protein